MKPTFTIAPDGQSITCHKCGKTSHHPEDVKQAYCGSCHFFHITMSTVELPVSTCPTCGYQVDSASKPITVFGERDQPVPGDLSICLKCGELLVFQRDMRLVIANLDDLNGLDERDMSMMELAQDKIRRERPLG